MKITIPAVAGQGQIDFAMLSFPAFQLTDTSAPVTIQAHRVTTAWGAASVTWNYPCARAGGDFDSAGLARWMIAPGDTHDVRLDITSAAQSWQTGASNHALILTRPPFEGGGFASEIENLREALRQARLKLYYHHV